MSTKSAGQNFAELQVKRAELLEILSEHHSVKEAKKFDYQSEAGTSPKGDSGHSGLHVVQVTRVPVSVPNGPPINGWQLYKNHPTDTDLQFDILEHSPDCDHLKYLEVCSVDAWLAEFSWAEFLEDAEICNYAPEGDWFVWTEWEKHYSHYYGSTEYDMRLNWNKI